MKFCNKCGTQLEDDAVFCANCGAEQKVSQPAQPVQYAQPTYQQPVNQQYVPQPAMQPQEQSQEQVNKSSNKKTILIVVLSLVAVIVIAAVIVTVVLVNNSKSSDSSPANSADTTIATETTTSLTLYDAEHDELLNSVFLAPLFGDLHGGEVVYTNPSVGFKFTIPSDDWQFAYEGDVVENLTGCNLYSEEYMKNYKIEDGNTTMMEYVVYNGDLSEYVVITEYYEENGAFVGRSCTDLLNEYADKLEKEFSSNNTVSVAKKNYEIKTLGDGQSRNYNYFKSYFEGTKNGTNEKSVQLDYTTVIDGQVFSVSINAPTESEVKEIENSISYCATDSLE